MREAARLLERQIGRSRYGHLNVQCHAELAFLERTADTERAEVQDGADSYWIRGGKVRAMSVHTASAQKGRDDGRSHCRLERCGQPENAVALSWVCHVSALQ